MTNQNESNKTKRNRFTRMCIGEALLTLLADNDYDSIKISDIVAKAGISRMTYYNYYRSKTDILDDYLQEVVALYLRSAAEEEVQNNIGVFQDYDHILHALNFFDQYSNFFLTLAHAGLYSVIINAVNRYMEEQMLPNYDGSIYALYFYSGALINTFLKWEENGKVESIEEIAKIVSSLHQKNDLS